MDVTLPRYVVPGCIKKLVDSMHVWLDKNRGDACKGLASFTTRTHHSE